MIEAYIPTAEQTARELEAMAVYVMGGTVQSTVSFSGTINADIGSVKINDNAGNFAEVPAANSVKNGGNKALLVQQIDETGATLRQSTQVAMMNAFGSLAQDADIHDVRNSLALVANNQGTVATETTSVRIANSLGAILNSQGTQSSAGITTAINNLQPTLTATMNYQGTLATASAQVTTNAYLLSIDAQQATAVNQVTEIGILNTIASNQTPANSTLTAILNAQGTQSPTVLQPAIGVVANNQGTLATSALQVTGHNLQAAGNTGIVAVMNNQGTLAAASDVRAVNTTAAVVMNNQGTQATAANQLAANSTLAVIMNAQGTQATATGQQVTNDTLSKLYNAQGTATVGALIPPTLVIMNNQGTLATSANQVLANNSLTAILNTQGTQASQATAQAISQAATAIMNTQGTQATAANQTTSNAYLLSLVSGQANQATAANQVISNAQMASVIRTYGASGTASSANLVAQVGLDPSSASTDSFGRLRVSSPDYRFDGQLTYDIPTDLWDRAWNSTGTVTYDRTNRMAIVTCAATGTAVLQSHKYAPYTPGRSQLAFITFIMGAAPAANVSRRAGYWDGLNGIYLEQTSAGVQLVLASTTANGDQTVPQADWNIDKMNGDGPSGLILDMTKVQILVVSLQALYAGRVVVGFDINGILWPVHAFYHANLINVPYIANASLPVRYEVRSAGGAATTMNPLCASVISEGGGNLSSIPGRTFAAARTTTITVSGAARLPIVSIRAKALYNGIPNTSLILPNTFSLSSSAQAAYVELYRNVTTLTNANWISAEANSVAEYDISATAFTGGTPLYGVVVGAGAGAAQMPIDANLLDRIIIAATPLLNTQDTLTLTAISLAGNTNVGGAMVWKEIR